MDYVNTISFQSKIKKKKKSLLGVEAEYVEKTVCGIKSFF